MRTQVPFRNGTAYLTQNRYELDEKLIKNQNGIQLKSKFVTKDGREKVNVLKYFVLNQINSCDNLLFGSVKKKYSNILKKYKKKLDLDSDSDSDSDSEFNSELEKIKWDRIIGDEYFKDFDYDEFNKLLKTRPVIKPTYKNPILSPEDQVIINNLQTQRMADEIEYKNINNRFVAALTQADPTKFGEITVINDKILEDSFLYKDLLNYKDFCVKPEDYGEIEQKNWKSILNSAMINCKNNVLFIYSHTFDPENPNDPNESEIILHSVVIFRITFKENLENFTSNSESKYVLYIHLLCSNQYPHYNRRLDNKGATKLLNLLFETAPLIDVQEVVLESSTRAKSFYEKLGFRKGNRRDFGGDSYVLVLSKQNIKKNTEKLSIGGKKSKKKIVQKNTKTFKKPLFKKTHGKQ